MDRSVISEYNSRKSLLICDNVYEGNLTYISEFIAETDLKKALKERAAYEMLSEGSVEERASKKDLVLKANRRIAELIAIVHQ